MAKAKSRPKARARRETSGEEMPGDVLLRYVGDYDGQKRHIVGVPGTDLTRAQVAGVAANRRMEPEAVVAWLLETDAYCDPDDDEPVAMAAPPEEPAPAPRPSVFPGGMEPESPWNPGAWQPASDEPANDEE